MIFLKKTKVHLFFTASMVVLLLFACGSGANKSADNTQMVATDNTNTANKTKPKVNEKASVKQQQSNANEAGLESLENVPNKDTTANPTKPANTTTDKNQVPTTQLENTGTDVVKPITNTNDSEQPNSQALTLNEKSSEESAAASTNGNVKPQSGSKDVRPEKPSTSTSKPQSPKPPKTSENSSVNTSVNVLTLFTSTANNFFGKYVSDGKVDYNGVKKSIGELNVLVKQIAEMKLNQASSEEKQAFYINAYNVLVIKSVIDNNLPKSPLDVAGFFNANKHQVAGNSVTLDYLEKTLLFNEKNDARFHFAVVCAAVGCPQIENFAYMPDKLNRQLTKQTQKAVNDNNFIRLDAGAQTVGLSKIFEWYAKDFTRNGSVIDYINQYRNTPIPADYKVTYYEYDWSLNIL